jgi:hypothetical protein
MARHPAPEEFREVADRAFAPMRVEFTDRDALVDIRAGRAEKSPLGPRCREMLVVDHPHLLV